MSKVVVRSANKTNMKKLRIIVLVHADLAPPDTIEGLTDKEVAPWKTEFDVIATLKEMGHEVQTVGCRDDLLPIREAIRDFQPQVTFVLLEEFHGVATYDQHVVSYLELMRQPYTGCNPRGLLLSHDKALSKKIFAYHRIPTPHFAIFPRGRKVQRPKRLAFPLLVKSATEDASLGISQSSIVRDDAALVERVQFVHDKILSDAMVEEYVEGRELYVGVLGNDRLQTFPVWEMKFDKMPDDVARIATAKVKWDHKYQERHGITTEAAGDLPDDLVARITRGSKRIFRALNMSGYARMDLRLREDGKVFVLEANANPNLAYGEDFAESAETIGISYEELLSRIINLGLRYRAPWQM